jgi:hypothetical protein
MLAHGLMADGNVLLIAIHYCEGQYNIRGYR